MIKEVWLFPGQGLPAADIVSFYGQLDRIDPQFTSRRLAQAQEVLNRVHGSSAFDVLSSLNNVDSASFSRTAFIQPVTYALSTTVYQMAKTRGAADPYIVAGLSVGEYAAITAAGVIEYEEGLEIVTNRGQFTQDAYDKNPSTLALLMGTSPGTAAKICSQSTRGVCPDGAAEIAIFSTPDMVVVGCAEKSVPIVEQLAKNAGVGRARSLHTPGAFHTSYMEDAARKLAELLQKYPLGEVQIPVIANLSAAIIESGIYSAANLVGSMTEPVQWARTIFTLKYLQADKFMEVGPGNSLQILNRRNNVAGQTSNVLDCFIPQLVG